MCPAGTAILWDVLVEDACQHACPIIGQVVGPGELRGQLSGVKVRVRLGAAVARAAPFLGARLARDELGWTHARERPRDEAAEGHGPHCFFWKVFLS